MSDITIAFIVFGFVLTILGYFFPQLDALMPGFINRFWRQLRFDDISAIAPASVSFFIRWTEQIANFTATGARSLVVSIPIVLIAIWPVFTLANIGHNELDSGVDLSAVMESHWLGLLIATVVVIAAIIFIKLRQGPIQDLLAVSTANRRFARLRMDLVRISRQIEIAEKELAEARRREGPPDHDTLVELMSGELEWMQSFQKRIEKRLEEAREEKQKYRDEGKNERIQEYRSLGSIFWIFVISGAALIIYVAQIYSLIGGRVNSALFDSVPVDGAMAAIYLLVPTIVIFILMQSFVPALLTLHSPRNLIVKVAKGVSDPLGQNSVFIFLFGVSLSLIMTFGAFLVGHYFEPDAYVPQTLQMVASNAIFDGLTFAVTLFVMKRLERFRGWFAILVLLGLIAVDLLIAAVLAMASLYVGLLGTPEALSIAEVANILIGLSADGSDYSAGPLFWVMHTAFLPTIGYMAFILFWTLAKLIVSSMALVARGAASRGLMPTGGMIFALASISEVIPFMLPSI